MSSTPDSPSPRSEPAPIGQPPAALEPSDEAARLRALYATRLLDTPPEERFDRVTRLVQSHFQVQTVLLSLVDADRQWFKSSQGMAVRQTPRTGSFCGYAILGDGIFEVPDTHLDSRFVNHPLVVGPPRVRFYAGAPLATSDGHRIGTLCLVDPRPRTLSNAQHQALRDFADCLEAEINRELERELRQHLVLSEQRHRLVLEGTRIGTWEWNVATGATVFNERWAAIVGYTLEELQPISIETWNRLVHPQDAPVSAELLKRHFSGKLPFYDCQCRMLHKDGHWVWVHDRGRVMQRAVDGTPLLMYGTHTDISLQKEVERKLLDSRDQFLSLVNNLPGITYRCRLDREWTMLYMSQQIDPLTGYPASDFIGNAVRSFASIIHPEDRDLVDRAVTVAVASDQAWQLEYRVLHRGGDTRWVLERGKAVRASANHPLGEPGEVLYLDGLILDVTAEKQAKLKVERQILALSVINRIASNPETELDSQIHYALEEARVFLGMERGVVSIEEDGECLVAWVAAPGEAGLIGASSCQPGKSHCALDIAAEEVVAEHDLGRSDHCRHACYLADGQQAYLGIRLVVAGQTFGILNFSSRQVRPQPFDDTELMFVRLLARWIGASIERTQAQQRLHKLVSQVPGMVYQFQRWPDGRVALPFVSPGVRDLFGVWPEEVVEDAGQMFGLVHPDDLPRLQQSIEESSTAMTLWSEQYRITRSDGQFRWIKGSAVPEKLADGSVLWNGYVYDITEQKQSELLIQRSEARLRGLFELAPVGIALNDYETGAFIEVNEALAAPTGYSREEFKHLHYRQITPPEHWLADAVQMRRLRETGRCGPFEKEYLRRDGGRYPVVINAMVVGDTAGGNMIWSIVEDISERKRQQRALERINERLTLAADSARFGVWDYDLLRNELQWDDWMYRLYGLQRSAFRSAFDAWQGRAHPDDAGFLNQELARVLRSGREFNHEFRVIWPDGQIRHLKSAGVVTRDAHGVAIRVTGINYDITESKIAERMKSEFVSTVSHELRTPLTSIAGALGLLAGGVLGTLPAVVQEMIAIAHNNSQRLTYLINDLLDMEKLISGRLKLDLKPQALLPLVLQGLREIQGYAGKYQIPVRLLEPGTDGEVRVDAQRAGQILANFLSNAIKYAPVATPVEVSVRRVDGHLRVTVRDHGPGIPLEFRARIFEKFAQADSSDRRQKGGTGLGLAISRALAEQMGGRVGYDSEPGEGAAFFVEWPEVGGDAAHNG